MSGNIPLTSLQYIYMRFPCLHGGSTGEAKHVKYIRVHVSAYTYERDRKKAEIEMVWESWWVCALFCLNASSSAASVYPTALPLVFCLCLDTLLALRWRDYICASPYTDENPPRGQVVQRFVFVKLVILLVRWYHY